MVFPLARQEKPDGVRVKVIAQSPLRNEKKGRAIQAEQLRGG